MPDRLCAHCSATHDSNARYCITCGAALPDADATVLRPISVVAEQASKPAKWHTWMRTAAIVLTALALTGGAVRMMVTSQPANASSKAEPSATASKEAKPVAEVKRAKPQPRVTVTATVPARTYERPSSNYGQSSGLSGLALACAPIMPASQVGPGSGNTRVVAAIQSGLRALQYTGLSDGAILLAVDGSYGAHTTYAVSKFQRNHGLSATGVMDQTTWSEMNLSLRTWQGVNRC